MPLKLNSKSMNVLSYFPDVGSYVYSLTLLLNLRETLLASSMNSPLSGPLTGPAYHPSTLGSGFVIVPILARSCFLEMLFPQACTHMKPTEDKAQVIKPSILLLTNEI